MPGFPGPDYYEGSAPTRRHQPAADLAHHNGGRHRAGSHVHSLTVQQGRQPALPRQHRCTYAADLRCSLRTEAMNPASESPPPWGRALQTGPYPPDLSRRGDHGASTTDSLAFYLLVSLAGPTPSGSTGMSRRCQGCSHPPLRSQDQAAPSFSWSAATDQRRSPFITTRSNSASWRTITSPHSGSLHGLRGYPRRHASWGVASQRGPWFGL